jgi:hypothetical protein
LLYLGKPQDRNGFPRPHFPPLETPRPDWLPYKTVPHSPEKRYKYFDNSLHCFRNEQLLSDSLEHQPIGFKSFLHSAGTLYTQKN